MLEQHDQETRRRRVFEIFDELRAAKKSHQEIYAEAASGLKQLARKMISRQHPGDSLTASRLLNDVYIKLFERPPSDFQWESGEDFFLAVTWAMRDLKRDYVRKKLAAKRGGGKVDQMDGLEGDRFQDVSGPPSRFDADAVHTVAIHKALKRLKEEFPDLANIITLAYWDNEGEGLTRDQIAVILKVTPDQVKYKLNQARARMKHYLTLSDI